MKKVIFALAAVVALAACSNEETIVRQDREAIDFNNLFVNNSTRAIDGSYSNDNMPASFNVYGTTQGDETDATVVTIFNGVVVENTNGVWDYADDYVQYWIDGNTYNFAAVVNGTIANDKTISYTADGTTDLLYAVNKFGKYIKGTSATTVPFEFSHLLSKAMFTVENTITTNTTDNAYTYEVTDVKITNVYPNGVYDITKFGVETENGWIVSGTRKELSFGHVSNATNTEDAVDAIAITGGASATSRYSRLLVPNAYTDLNVTCTITTLLNGEVVNVVDYDNTIATTFEEGKAYNLVLSLGNPGEEIKFTCTGVKDWTNVSDTDM